MLIVDQDQTIHLTRGDTARFSVAIANSSGNDAYTMLDSDVLKFTVKKTVNDATALFQKISTGSNNFHIEPSDTRPLSFGKYVYDVELSTSSGDVYTVIPPSVFEVTKEVG